ncbi:MAG: LptA/OstA family protein [Pseudomonadota bacterium]
MYRINAWLLVFAAMAAQAGVSEQVQKVLSGQTQEPVNLSADRAEWREDGVMIYEGHVRLVSGALSLEGSRIEVRRLDAAQTEAEVSGTPARLVHAASAQSPAVSAESKTLLMNSKTGQVQLSGDARVARGAETLAGDVLRYDVTARRILGAGRIRMEVPSATIAPPPKP